MLRAPGEETGAMSSDPAADHDNEDGGDDPGDEARPGVGGFLRDNLRWWLLPMVLVVLLLLALALLNASQTLPFMYRLVEQRPAPGLLRGGGPPWPIRT
ncbi:MAG: DUF5989 family protein [Byssovorax sp.]